MPKDDPVANMSKEEKDVQVDHADAKAVAGPTPEAVKQAAAVLAQAATPATPEPPAPPKRQEGKPKPDPNTVYRVDVPSEMRGGKDNKVDETIPGGFIVKRENNRFVVVDADGKELPGHRPFVSPQKTIEVEKS